MTRELTEMLRKNRTIDWQKKETARAGMRKMVKRLLKKYKYPPEGMDNAVQTVMTQCELWTDNMEVQGQRCAKMTNEIIIAIISAVTGGIVTLLTTLALERRKEKREDRLETKKLQREAFQNCPEMQTRIKTYTDWTAQIIQHEIDHCNGILI